MQKLPLTPIVYIILYVSLTFVSVLFQFYAWQFYAYIAFFAVISALLLHLIWTFQSLQFVLELSHHNNEIHAKRARMVKYSIIGIVPFVIAIILYSNYVAPHFADTQVGKLISGFLLPLLFLAAVLVFLWIFWVAAVTLCDAESETKISRHHAVGTFLLYLYLVIGAPFIFQRLKNLRKAATDQTS